MLLPVATWCLFTGQFVWLPLDTGSSRCCFHGLQAERINQCLHAQAGQGREQCLSSHIGPGNTQQTHSEASDNSTTALSQNPSTAVPQALQQLWTTLQPARQSADLPTSEAAVSTRPCDNGIRAHTATGQHTSAEVRCTSSLVYGLCQCVKRPL